MRIEYKKGYSFIVYRGNSIKGICIYRKCDKEGYLIYEDTKEMFYIDFQENVKSMKGRGYKLAA